MSSHWQRVKEVFERARALSSEERAAYLEVSCQSEPDVRSEVESLLSAYESGSEFLEKPALDGAAECLIGSLPDPWLGKRIGAYELLAELGHGGMGSVYLAVRKDDQFQQRVAIKLIKRGMDTDSIIRRFRNERQILASMDHPNIAKLMDAGVTPNLLPYFVMELIEGQPITEYCDRRRLSIRERLLLFQTVCAAVQHAHCNLIVHRDIKPGNILVTAVGIAKLLDFGVAKLLNPELSFSTIHPTIAELRMFTPAYASPEQVHGEPITTAADVYSLGVVLYELLAGRVPNPPPPKSQHEPAKGTGEPAPPSFAIRFPGTIVGSPNRGIDSSENIASLRDTSHASLRKQLKGDLDNIVLKALKKDAHRRYGSAEQFSEDIRRFLEGLPVSARKDSLGYRAGKFLGRHKSGVATAVLLLLALCGGVAATAWEAHVAQAQRARAERRFNDVRKLANSYLFEFHDAIKNLPGSTPARQLLVKRALEYLDDLSREGGNDPGIQRELATAYEKVGDVEGKPGAPNLGNSKAALDSYSKALLIRESLASANPGSFDDRLALANTYFNFGKMQQTVGNLKAALATTQKASALGESLVGLNSGNSRAQALRAMTLDTIGDLQDGLEVSSHLGDAGASLENHRKARSIYEEVLRTDPANVDIQMMLSVCNLKIGDAMVKRGQLDAALSVYRRSLEDFGQRAGTPNDPKLRRNIAAVYYRIGFALDAKGDIPGSFENYSRGLAISRDWSAADPKNERARLDVAYGLLDVGESAARMGRIQSGSETLRKAVSALEGLNASDPDNAEIQGTLVSAYRSASEVLNKPASSQERLAYLKQGWTLGSQMLAKNPQDIDARSKTISIGTQMGDVLMSQGKAGSALEMYRANSEFTEPLLRSGREPSLVVAQHFAGLGRASAAVAMRLPASSVERLGLCDESEKAFEKSLKLFSELASLKVLKGRLATESIRIAHEFASMKAGCWVFALK